MLLLLQEIDKIIIGHIAHQYTTDMQLINTLLRIQVSSLKEILNAAPSDLECLL